MSTIHPTALEWSKLATGEATDPTTSASEALKAFRNELQGLSTRYRLAMTAEMKADLTTHGERIRLINRYVAVQTLHHVVHHILNTHETTPGEAFVALMQSAATRNHAPPELRAAFQKAKADAKQYCNGAAPQRTRRNFLVQAASAVVVAPPSFPPKSAMIWRPIRPTPKRHPIHRSIWCPTA